MAQNRKGASLKRVGSVKKNKRAFSRSNSSLAEEMSTDRNALYTRTNKISYKVRKLEMRSRVISRDGNGRSWSVNGRSTVGQRPLTDRPVNSNII
ncbi:1299_t:CDS:2 [Funneliformis mosseae]|uniref:1299_t:CDS:1 n=1 Tax=Funneliformis mosseae TaxID=27381 RepID=A0A9N8ZTI9_FUNMO|nr:1299_t:CDS:2 [Funneliformis mosseae]